MEESELDQSHQSVLTFCSQPMGQPPQRDQSEGWFLLQVKALSFVVLGPVVARGRQSHLLTAHPALGGPRRDLPSAISRVEILQVGASSRGIL